MNTLLAFGLLVFMIYAINSCSNENAEKTSQNLYSGFQNPPAEARPFVRWWWNGNKIKAGELERELELLKAAGFGGVEINPIAMPVAFDTDDKSLIWMSDEWIDMVVHACKKTKDLGMIADIIAGTGWPFGGEFLQDKETCQRVVSENILYKSGSSIQVDEASLIALYKEKNKNARHISERTTYRLSYLNLIPLNCSSASEVINLMEKMDEKGKLSYRIEAPGQYLLCYGLIQQNFRDVYLGAPGGAGPVMDHYKKDITIKYLSRLKEISERSGIPLSDLIRAVFCDSIELSGANWTDGFAALFFEVYGYKLDSWLPFVFYTANADYSDDIYSKKFTPEFKDQIKRVRYDFNKLLVETFLENFTQAFRDFCHENDLLCRYQAYGTPFLMGMLDGYMIPDIPESNNWIYSAEMKDSLWQWNQSHGYMLWNMYAAAGAHLSGKRITSCESMTNLGGVFKTTLEEIKQHDDMNFITGMNHSVLHGFNYSPPEVPFPGWIRYGAYFSEHNTWWEHLPLWIEYNSRLSYVFQNSQADKSIAIIGPTADLWGDYGLVREKFHMTPDYLYKLWEPISQLGYSSEYINQGVLERSEINDGKISFGNMSYDLIVLADLKSINPETAVAIRKLLESGGKVVVIDGLPEKSLHFNDFEENDEMVKKTMEEILAAYPESFIQINSPQSLNELFSWTKSMLNQSGIAPDVVISNPGNNVYQIHQYTDNKDIYFFTNIHRYEATSFEAKFPVEGKYPWVWNPESGERNPYYYESTPNELNVSLDPLTSLLLIFEDEKPDLKGQAIESQLKNSKSLDAIWTVTGKQIDNQSFTWEMTELIDFSQSDDPTQFSFGGYLTYKTMIDNKGDFTHIDLGDVNEGVTELFVNGEKVGEKWYGKAIFPVEDYLVKGNNEIEIRYTTVLANYCKSIDNPLTKEWTRRYEDLVPTGLEGPVKLLAY